MEYNKNRFNKVNDKKILHKIKKHWVVISMTLLGLIGATGAKANVHASVNHANVNPNQDTSHVRTQPLSRPYTLLTGQHHDQSSQLAQRIHDSEQLRNHASFDHRSAERALNHLNRQSTDQQRALQSGSASEGATQSGRAGASSVAVTSAQVSHAASQTQQHEQLVKQAKQQWRYLGQNELGDAAPKSMDLTQFKSTLENVNNTYSQISSLLSDNASMSDQADSASDVAWAEINRYSWIDPKNIDTNPSDANYGSQTAGYGFSDDSDAALGLNTTLRNQSGLIEDSSVASNSINASLGSSDAASLAAVNNEEEAHANTAALDSLAAKMNAVLSNMNKCSASASTALQQVSLAESGIIKDFSSVSARADAVASAYNTAPYTGHASMGNVVPQYNNRDYTSYPVVNVYNFNELDNAAMNSNVKQINVMTNMNAWSIVHATNGEGEDYTFPYAHNMKFNGLRDDGKWNTIDMGEYNFTLDNGAAPNTYYAMEIENLNLYGTDFYGPFASNDGVPTIQIFNNLNYSGVQLAYNTQACSGIFEGKIRANCGAAYSPNGHYQHYDYDADGLSPVPYLGDHSDDSSYDLALPEDAETNYGIDTVSNQQFLQLNDNQSTVFKPNCNFRASTTNSNVIEFNAEGHVILDHDAYVHLIPRGYAAENNGLPAGINMGSNQGSVDVGNGATLYITPSIETDKWCGGQIPYAPAALITTQGSIVVNAGGTFKVFYPDINGVNGVQPHGLPPTNGYDYAYGAVSMNGSGSSIDAKPYSNFIVDGNNPSNSLANNDGSSVWGCLVSFGSSGSAGSINAEKNSTVLLKVGGSTPDAQPVTLFEAPGGTPVKVTDPKEFSLYCGGNYWADPDRDPNKHTLAASSGVGIQGNQIDFMDYPDDYIDDEHTLNNKSAEDFGQFNQLTLPGGNYAYDPDSNNQFFQGLAKNGLGEIADLFPYGKSNINPGGVALLDNSIGQSVNAQNQTDMFSASALSDLNRNKTGEKGPTGKSFWYGSSALGIVRMPVNVINKKLGLDISNGFSFKGVPSPYVEGVHAGSIGSDSKNNNRLIFNHQQDKEGDWILSGYSQPYSYIRINSLQDYQNDHGRNSTPLHVGALHDDHKYDSSLQTSQIVPVNQPVNGQQGQPYDSYDSYTNGYNTVADGNGYWTCKVPGAVNGKNVSLDQLVATSHTLTVAANTDAARRVQDYSNGMQDISNKGDRVSNSSNFYQNSSNFPSGTYSTVDDGTPGRDDDPTYTDDDDAVYDYGTQGNSDIEPVHNLNSEQDDNYAGQYFWAGRLKGTFDQANLETTNSIYSLPLPFIIGYETAKAASFDINSMSNDINGIISYVKNIKSDVKNFLPPIKKDESSADTSMSNINTTISTVDSLLTPLDTVDPYLNLRGLKSSLASPSATDQDYDKDIHLEYSAVNEINGSLSDILNTLSGYKNSLSSASNSYNSYYAIASSDAKTSDSADKYTNLRAANQASSSANNLVSEARSDSASASSYDSVASNDNQSASSDSNDMLSSYDEIRTSASNSEATDFDSVASSYSNSATSDRTDIIRDSTEISHRDQQMNIADGIYSNDEVQMSNIAASLSGYLPVLNSLRNLSMNGANADALHASYSNDYSSASSALSFLNSVSAQAPTNEDSDIANSGYGNQDSSSASSASADEVSESGVLSTAASIVRSDSTEQLGYINARQFDLAQSVNNKAFSSLDSVADASASNDVTITSSAWAQIRGLHDKLIRAEVSVTLPRLGAEVSGYGQTISLARTMQSGNAQSGHSSTGSSTTNHQSPSSSSANHASDNSAGSSVSPVNPVPQRYHGTYTVTMQDEDLYGRHTSWDVETIPVDQPVGTVLTVDPKQYLSSGFHMSDGDHTVHVRVTQDGVRPRNVTFYYQVDGRLPSGADQPASHSAQPQSGPASSSINSSSASVRPQVPASHFADHSSSNPISNGPASLHSSANNASVHPVVPSVQPSAPSSSSAGPVSPASNSHHDPIWVDGHLISGLDSGSASTNSDSNNSVASPSASDSVGDSSSDPAVTSSSAEESSADSSSSSSQDSADSSSASASSDPESASADPTDEDAPANATGEPEDAPTTGGATNATSADHHTDPESAKADGDSGDDKPDPDPAESDPKKPSPAARHQFMKHYRGRILGAHHTAATAGARAADEYADGIDDARQGNSASSSDPHYLAGYNAFHRAAQDRELPQTGEQPMSLTVALLLVLGTVLSSMAAADRRHYRE